MSVEDGDDPIGNMNRATRGFAEAFRNAGRAMSNLLPDFARRNPNAHFRLVFRGNDISTNWFERLTHENRILSREIRMSSSGDREFCLVIGGSDLLEEIMSYLNERNARIIDVTIDRNDPRTMSVTRRTLANPSGLTPPSGVSRMDLSAIEQQVASRFASEIEDNAMRHLTGRVSDGVSSNDMADAMRMAFTRQTRDLPNAEIAFVVPEFRGRHFLVSLQVTNVDAERDQMRGQDVVRANITADVRIDSDRLRGYVGGSGELEVIKQHLLEALDTLLNNRMSRSSEPDVRHRDERTHSEEDEVTEPPKGKRHIDLT